LIEWRLLDGLLVVVVVWVVTRVVRGRGVNVNDETIRTPKSTARDLCDGSVGRAVVGVVFGKVGASAASGKCVANKLGQPVVRRVWVALTEESGGEEGLVPGS